jgi:hypothetical protein
MTPETFFNGPRKDLEDLARAKYKVMWRPPDLESWNRRAQKVWEEICRFIRRPAARADRINGDLSDLIALLLVLTDMVDARGEDLFPGSANQPAEDMLALCLDITLKKNPDYAGREDFANNFVETGRRMGVRAIQTWLAYADKHWCSVTNFVIHGKLESEPIVGRIADVINYCGLLSGMVAAGVAVPQPKLPS